MDRHTAARAFEENREQLVRITSRAARKWSRYGIEFDDLFQEACCAFLRTFVKYREHRGDLQHYASKAARNAVNRHAAILRSIVPLTERTIARKIDSGIWMRPVSIDAPVSEGDDRALSDFMASSGSLIELVEQRDAALKIEQAVLRNLSDREALVIQRRFLDEEEHTLADVGKEIRVIGERARQIEAAALEKLRHKRAGLRELVEE